MPPPRPITAAISRKSNQNNVSGMIVGLVVVAFVVAISAGAFLYVQAVRSVQQPVKRLGQPERLSDGGRLVLKTSEGNIRIALRPDLSPESCEYIHNMVDRSCSPCNFYRADGPGILQGIMKNEKLPTTKEKGKCPEKANVDVGKCPEWDPNCGCHGPIMEHGMVGWAGGGTGPDFFIDTYHKPAKFWSHQHTVWGRILDDESFAVIDKIYKLPTEKSGMMTYLKQRIHFEMEII